MIFQGPDPVSNDAATDEGSEIRRKMKRHTRR